MAVPRSMPSRLGRLQRIAAAARAFILSPPPAVFGDDGWALDDLAERIGTGDWVAPNGDVAQEPVAGHVDVVRGVRLSRGTDGRYRLYLIFSRWPGRMFDARGFRKLTPRADAARAADPAFVRQLKARTLASPAALSIAARLKRILS